MAIPPKHNYRFYEGDDSEIVIRYKDPTGLPIDISADTLLVHVRDLETNNLIFSLTGTVDTLLTNQVVFNITSAQSTGLAEGDVKAYCYDVQRTYDSGSSIETILNGLITFYKEVTA